MLKLPNNHPAVQAFRLQHNVCHGVTAQHTCSLSHCTFAPLQQSSYYFCKTSLHAHVCTQYKCTLAESQDCSGILTCPLTGIEMKERNYVQQETIKINGRGGNRFLQAGVYIPHTNNTKLTKRKKKPPVVTAAIITTVIAGIIKCKQTAELSTLSMAAKIVKKHTRFTDALQQMIKHCALYSCNELPPAFLVQHILEYSNRVYKTLSPLPTPSVFVAVCLSLLQSGLSARGVVIFPRVGWVAAMAPPLTGYARIKHVQCRAMSICTRALKARVFQNNAISSSCIFQPLPQ